jgi:NADPH:quinone reductase-like Zn-dependent oxidoreductase
MAGSGPEKAEDILTLAELCSSGVYRPYIGATFSFDQIALAHELVESGHKRGNAVIRMMPAE